MKPEKKECRHSNLGIAHSKRRQNGLIELCRFIFMLGIVSHHAMFLRNTGYIPIWGGYISTDFFFILTGYFLFHSAQKNGSSLGEEHRFESALYQVWSKFKQFYPYFLVSFIVSFAMYHMSNKTIQLRTIFVDFVKGIPQLLFLSQAGLGGMNDGVCQYNGPMWYISVLLIAILVVYPLMRCCKIYFPTAIAPVLTLLCYGYIMTQYESLGAVNQWSGFCYAGCLRAIGGLCLGGVLHYLVQSISKRELTRLGNMIVCTLQLGTIAMSLYLMSQTYGYTDIIQIILFSILILVTFAEDSFLNRLCTCNLCYALGKFSMTIFTTQCLAYSYPDLLPYPTQWLWRYASYIGYVLLFSLANYVIVAGCKRLIAALKLKELLWMSEKDG